MEFNEIKEKVIKNAERYSKKYDINIDKEFALTKLYEEVGEFSQAILTYQKKCRPEKIKDEKICKEDLADELSDILGMLIINAYLLDIDLEKAIKEKWISKVK